MHASIVAASIVIVSGLAASTIWDHAVCCYSETDHGEEVSLQGQLVTIEWPLLKEESWLHVTR